MAAQKIFNTLFVVLAALFCVIIALAQASPVPNVESETVAVAAAEDGDNLRDGRFYGMGGSQASAVAVANAGASGFGGYPYGGGIGLASSFANANANAGSFGYGK